MTIEDLLTEIVEHGWRLNNLFQRSDGIYQANLRRQVEAGHWVTDFAIGPTAESALTSCVDKIESAEFIGVRKAEPTAYVPSARSLVDVLGLLKPLPIINRRL